MADFKGFKVDGKEYPWGDYVTAGRKENTTAGDNSTAEGIDTQATATASHAEGKASQASNFSAHAEGFGTLASGYGSHAEGGSTQATQNYAHAEGYNTVASSIEAHAEGTDTRASSSHAHAEGYATVAGGLAAHAEGFGTTATHQAQHVFGQYNALDPSQADEYHQGNYVEIVGNGTADNARSNARTLDWSGNEVLAGKLTVGSAPTNNMDVATKQYVDDNVTHYELITIATTDWDSSTNIATKTATTVTANNTVLVAPTVNSQSDYILYGITPINQSAQQIQFHCITIPATDIEINLAIL